MNLPVQSETTLIDWKLADEDFMIRKLTTEVIRHMVSKNIVCASTGNVLDVRTCTAFADADGDVRYVVDPSCDTPEIRQQLRERTSLRYVVIR